MISAPLIANNNNKLGFAGEGSQPGLSQAANTADQFVKIITRLLTHCYMGKSIAFPFFVLASANIAPSQKRKHPKP